MQKEAHDVIEFVFGGGESLVGVGRQNDLHQSNEMPRHQTRIARDELTVADAVSDDALDQVG